MNRMGKLAFIFACLAAVAAPADSLNNYMQLR